MAGFEFLPLPESAGAGASVVLLRNGFRIAVARQFVRWLTKPRSFAGRIVRSLVGWKGSEAELAEALRVIEIVRASDEADLVRFDRLLDQFRPSVLLVGEDGIGGNAAMIATARAKGIPVIDIPYEFSNKQQLLRATAPNPKYLAPLVPVRRRWFPKWILRAESPILTVSPPHIALAREVQGLAPRIPGTVHGGYADKLAVESPQMRRHYLREGLRRRKLANVGMLALDDICAGMESEPELAGAFASGTKIRAGRTTVRCSFVPDYVESTRDRCDLLTYEELLDFWIDTVLSQPDVDPVFQAHPAISAEARRFIGSRVPLSNADLTAILPRCDVFVTSVSSTIRWAIACRKPVINYDVYRFDYPDYLDAPGVSNVDTKDAFADAVRRLCSGGADYAAASAALAAGYSNWGALDGKAGARLAELVDQAVGR